jgi:hypothetical protein
MFNAHNRHAMLGNTVTLAKLERLYGYETSFKQNYTLPTTTALIMPSLFCDVALRRLLVVSPTFRDNISVPSSRIKQSMIVVSIRV